MLREAIKPFWNYLKIYLPLIVNLIYFLVYCLIVVSATFTGVETLEWPWFYHRREHFLLIIVSEVGQSYQQNGGKLRAEIFLSTTISCKHFDMVLKLMRYNNARVVFNFPSSFHKAMSSSKYRVQSILWIKTCKVLVSWVVNQIF